MCKLKPKLIENMKKKHLFKLKADPLSRFPFRKRLILFCIAVPLIGTNVLAAKTTGNSMSASFSTEFYSESLQDLVKITGTVMDENNVPLPNVNITIAGTSKGTMTDFDGNYEIEVEKGQSLNFSSVGFADQSLTVTDEGSINVQMKQGDALDEVVLIGYGSVQKRNLSGAISSIDSDAMQASMAKDASTALQGRIAGVDVTSLGGQPGSGMNINIRGISSLGSNTPLYVIDGVYGDINMVDPEDIETIDVLKDASAAAIYGSRAANGVVLITTKSGKRNTETIINFNAYTGVQHATKKLDVLNAQQWLGVMEETGYLPEQAKGFQGQGTDWQDEVFRVAPVSKANVNISGGGENSTYNVSAGYLNQKGVLITSGYEEVNFRTKNTFNFFDNHFRVGNTVMINSSTKDINDMVITDPLRQNPLLPVYDEDQLGGYAGVASWMKNMDNPVGYANLFENTRKGTEILANAYAEVDLGIKGLKYKMNVGFNKNSYHNRNYNAPHDFGSGAIQSSLGESASFDQQWLLENTLHFDRNFDKHQISLLAGYSAQKNTARGLSVSRKDIPFGTDAIDAGSPSEQQTGGSLNQYALASSFGRLIYSYDSRYIITGSVRRDGSSRFAKGHRYGVFPSFSVGWNIMNEDFFENLTTSINELKVRASYGVLGNQEIGNYTTQSTTTSDLNYMQGDNYWIGKITGAAWVSPKDLTWEETKTTNFGLDLSLLEDKFFLTADYYIKKTDGVLLSIGMPQSAGLSGQPTMNAGVVENKGFEVMLGHVNQVGDWKYNVSVNGSTVSNKITDITVGNTQRFSGFNPHGEGTVTWARLGDPIGSFYLVKTDGLFQSEAEVDAHQTGDDIIQPSAKPGDIRFEDYNGDGQISDDDRQYAGSPFPKFSFGIRGNVEYKGFDLGIFFDGMSGNKIYNYTRARMESFNEITNFGSAVLNTWTPQNTNTDVPRFTQDDNNNNRRRVSDRWLEDGSFFRLKTVELGYTFRPNSLESINIKNLRIYVAGENLFTTTKYKGYTPDLGEYDGQNGQQSGTLTRGTDYGRFPMARTLMLGVQVSL